MENAEQYQREQHSALMAYRASMVATEQRIQEDLDKAVVSLSGGALGVSFIFLKDIVAKKPVAVPWMLMTAWGLWAAAIVAVLASYYIGSRVFRKTIDQVDDGTIHFVKSPGGRLDTVAAVLNVLSGLLFVLGVVAMMVFVHRNLI